MNIEINAKTRKVFTVIEITRKISSLLEGSFGNIWVSGEISNYRKAASGHIYFTLKDESAVIKAVLFKGYQQNIHFKTGDGLKVIVHGNIDVFDKRGEYQIIIDLMEPEGIGALQLAFEKLKQRLQKEGFFDESHKKKIPAFPDSIGVITSQTGAALRDILNITARRYKGIRIIIYPVLVQGDGAAEEITAAINTANIRMEADVLIVGRGGGSIEDLWPFNEEIVARAIYDSKIPVISAVGHEIDFTISDFVADLRAPTPSAAAELVVKNKEELLKSSKELITRLYSSIDRLISYKKEKVSFYSIDFMSRRIIDALHKKNLIFDDVTKSLTNRVEAAIIKNRGRFEKTVGQLNALSPLNTLARGFAAVSRLPENTPVFSVRDVDRGDDIKTILKDGTLFSTIKGVEEKRAD
ncbi:MAG: exodeoxyribonuclease VII large subunit [Spirochaetes bacterium]|nr:exodeoxyribonuclease VII large subunit [Spirochaetota bacterium]